VCVGLALGTADNGHCICFNDGGERYQAMLLSNFRFLISERTNIQYQQFSCFYGVYEFHVAVGQSSGQIQTVTQPIAG
jgi:hypothetical protein